MAKMTAPFKRGQRLILRSPVTWGCPNDSETEVIYVKWMGFNRAALIVVCPLDNKARRFIVHVNDVKPVTQ
jgi:hypothetical protein